MTEYNNLGMVMPWVETAANEIGTKFGIATIGGWRASATDPNGHPAGRALDFMTPSESVGNALAAYAQSNWRRLGVEYVIWRQRIWSVARSGEGWRPMGDRGSPTANHMDHVHVNFIAVPPKSPAANGGHTVTTAPNGYPWDSPVSGAVGGTVSDPLANVGDDTPAPAGGSGSSDESVRDKVLKLVIVAVVVGTGVALIGAGASRATRKATAGTREDGMQALGTAGMFVPQLRGAAVAANAASAAKSSKGTRS